jgi:hypothetical protein
MDERCPCRSIFYDPETHGDPEMCGGPETRGDLSMHNVHAPVETVVDVDASDHDVECAICQDCLGDADAMFVLLAPCQHVFHDVCINTWHQQSNTCPTCRLRIEGTVPRRFR